MIQGLAGKYISIAECDSGVEITIVTTTATTIATMSKSRRLLFRASVKRWQREHVAEKVQSQRKTPLKKGACNVLSQFKHLGCLLKGV